MSDDYRDAAAIDWIVCEPADLPSGRELLEAAMSHLDRWGARRWYADGNLPCLGLYGVPNAGVAQSLPLQVSSTRTARCCSVVIRDGRP